MKELHINKIDCIVTDSKSVMVRHDGNVKDAVKTFEKSLNDSFSKYPDFQAKSDKNDLIFSSALRGLTFIMKNYVFRFANVSKEEVTKDFIYIKSVINRADEGYDIDNGDCVDSDLYLALIKKVVEMDIKEESRERAKDEKREAKRYGKKTAKYRYKLGDRYSLIKKSIFGENWISDEVFEVRKFIYSIGNNIVNSVIMKQISGNPYHTRTLNEYDCKAFHLKYEPGLYIFSMNTSFSKLDKDGTNKTKNIEAV